VVFRNALPLLVTAIALGVAVARLDMGAMLATVSRLRPLALISVVIALLGGNLLACYRLKLVAQDFGQKLSLCEAIVASTAGQLAGTFFFQVIGQTIARSAVLARSGISLPTTIVITGYERIVAACVSLLLAILGVTYLFGRISFDLAGGGLELLHILLGIALVAVAGFLFAWRGTPRRAT